MGDGVEEGMCDDYLWYFVDGGTVRVLHLMSLRSEMIPPLLHAGCVLGLSMRGT